MPQVLYRVYQMVNYRANFAAWKQLGKDERFSSVEDALAFAATLKGMKRKVTVSRLVDGSWQHEDVAVWDYVRQQGRTFTKRVK